MKYKTKYENESDTNEGEQQNTVPRRAYLKGLGTAAMVSGFGLSGTAAASEPSSEEIGYGEGGYGEFGYGGVNDSRDDVVELTIVVEDANGAAIEGAEVIIHDDPVRTIRTDGAGRVAVTLEEGAYNVEASKDGYYTEAVMGIRAANGSQASHRLILEI